MKFVSVCFVLFVCWVVKYDAALTRAQRSQIRTKLIKSGLNCIKEYPLSIELFKSLKEGTLPEDDNAKCFLKCIYKDWGIIEDNGKISEKNSKEDARKLFQEDEILIKIDTLIGECTSVNDEETSDGDKGCDRAKLVFECFLKHAPKLGLDFTF